MYLPLDSFTYALLSRWKLFTYRPPQVLTISICIACVCVCVGECVWILAWDVREGNVGVGGGLDRQGCEHAISRDVHSHIFASQLGFLLDEMFNLMTNNFRFSNCFNYSQSWDTLRNRLRYARPKSYHRLQQMKCSATPPLSARTSAPTAKSSSIQEWHTHSRCSLVAASHFFT